MLKIFDRHVNLAKFKNDTSVYKMLRDWMKNKPSSSDDQSNQDDSKKHVVSYLMIIMHS